VRLHAIAQCLEEGATIGKTRDGEPSLDEVRGEGFAEEVVVIHQDYVGHVVASFTTSRKTVGNALNWAGFLIY
jgi:hypothetical protein